MDCDGKCWSILRYPPCAICLLKEKYNGWTNIETWNTNLNLTSHSKGMEQTILRLMRGQHSNKFADNLETYVQIIWQGVTPDGHSLKPVNWVEIANSWLEAYQP